MTENLRNETLSYTTVGARPGWAVRSPNWSVDDNDDGDGPVAANFTHNGKERWHYFCKICKWVNCLAALYCIVTPGPTRKNLDLEALQKLGNCNRIYVLSTWIQTVNRMSCPPPISFHFLFWLVIFDTFVEIATLWSLFHFWFQFFFLCFFFL